MNSSAYNAIVAYREVHGDMVQRLNLLGLHDVFQEVIEEYANEMETFNKVLFYTIHCYSKESQYHIQYTDWEYIKKTIAKDVGIDTDSELFYDLSLLKKVGYAKSVRKYLDFQFSTQFKHLVMLKDLYQQMVNAAIENITDKDDIIMYDQKMKNSKHAKELYSEIAEWEQRIEQDTATLTKPIEQVNERIKKDVRSLRLEDHLKASELS